MDRGYPARELMLSHEFFFIVALLAIEHIPEWECTDFNEETAMRLTGMLNEINGRMQDFGGWA